MKMEVSSVQKLCIYLISAAFQRCRVSEDLCRLLVSLKRSSAADPSIVCISISDTGIGSCLEEFQDLNSCREFVDAGCWDGLLSVKTTSIYDDEIYHYQINLRECISSRRQTRLPTTHKNGAKFSGTEVCLSVCQSTDVLLAEFKRYFQKMLILNIPNIAIEVVVERGDGAVSQYENVFIANEHCLLPSSASTIDERLKSGFEDYVFKHGNSLTTKCVSCFPSWEHLKVGSGMACGMERNKSSELQMVAVIVISDLSEITNSCLKERGAETEVLYFKDFSPCSINKSSITALTTIDWKSYGLVLKRAVAQGACTVLEWENLPPHVHIDIVLHCYHKQVNVPSICQKSLPDRSLFKKAVKQAVDDLKERHQGVLLSAHALKICSYAPDLAKTISGLILSANDSEFQGECLSLFGFQPQDIGDDIVKDYINQKIISVIEMNDRKPQRSREAAPFLFGDGNLPESNFEDCEHDAVDDEFTFLD